MYQQQGAYPPPGGYPQQGGYAQQQGGMMGGGRKGGGMSGKTGLLAGGGAGECREIMTVNFRSPHATL